MRLLWLKYYPSQCMINSSLALMHPGLSLQQAIHIEKWKFSKEILPNLSTLVWLVILQKMQTRYQPCHADMRRGWEGKRSDATLPVRSGLRKADWDLGDTRPNWWQKSYSFYYICSHLVMLTLSTNETYLKNSWLAVEECLLPLVAWLVQLGVFQVLLQLCHGSVAWKELNR